MIHDSLITFYMSTCWLDVFRADPETVRCSSQVRGARWPSRTEAGPCLVGCGFDASGLVVGAEGQLPGTRMRRRQVHLALVFGVDETTAIRYADLARALLGEAADQVSQ
jgi:hypothetical protein